MKCEKYLLVLSNEGIEILINDWEEVIDYF